MRLALAASVGALALAVSAAPHPRARRRAIPMTKISGLTNDDGSVNLSALYSHREFSKRKIENGLKNFERNTGSKHPSDVDGHQKRGAGVPLTENQNRAFWYGGISVGTPGENFNILIDTGSTDTLLPSSSCSNCDGHTIYDPSSSSTSFDLNQQATFTYSDGSVAGVDVYTDTISVGGFTATCQTFGAALTYPAEFQSPSFQADGLMGFAMESISRLNSSSVFDTLVSQGALPEAVFSLKLSDDGAELYIGGTNDQLYNGDFTYVSVEQQGYWQVSLDNLQANGTPYLNSVSSIIDSGTTLIVGPSDQIQGLHSDLGGTPIEGHDGLYSYPCDSFPSISLTFGGQSFAISEETLNLGTVSPGSSDCVIGIESGNMQFVVIGDVFLRNVYTTFDSGNMQVGFAQLA